jgi:hypothetical protein
MSRMKTDRKAAQQAARRAWQRARQTAADAKPVAAQVKPLAHDTKDVASRGLRKARAWAAPQVERTGQVLQDTVAPKVAAALAESARRLDPEKPHRGRWRKVAGISVMLAAASAIIAALRKRITPAPPSASSDDDTSAADPAKAGANAEVKKPAHTS